MNYTHVQFISWELNTGPRTINIPGNSAPADLTGYYPGLSSSTNGVMDILSQCQDIEARIKFTEQALLGAAKAGNIDKSATTLKVFLAPEFLYRGAGGAYLHDLLNGWNGPAPAAFQLTDPVLAQNWPGLFGGLRALVNNDTFKDWVIAFGTAISASFATKLDPLPQTAATKAVVDMTVPAEIYNTSLIQLGGQGNDSVCYTSRKHYKSAIDFLKYGFVAKQFLKDNTATLDANTIALVQEDVDEGGAAFTLAGVNTGDGVSLNLGMEICLDHAVSGGFNSATHRYNNSFGRLRNAGRFVKIQLVPSAGMSLVGPSIRLEPGNSYAFNCDGLNTLPPLSSGCHIQIWRGPVVDVVAPGNKLLEANNGAMGTNGSVQTVPGSVVTRRGTVPAEQLWIKGAGHTRVLNTLPL